MREIFNLVSTAWHFLLEVAGENDYARYAKRQRAHGQQPMTPQAFYLWKISRQYSGISRCC